LHEPLPKSGRRAFRAVDAILRRVEPARNLSAFSVALDGARPLGLL